MNFFLAAVLLSIGFMVGLPSVVDEHLPSSAHVADSALTVMTVIDGSPAAQAGISQGDVVTLINGQSFSTAEEARTFISEQAVSGVEIQTTSTDGSEHTYQLQSEFLPEQQVTGVGVGLVQTGLVSYSFFYAIIQGVSETVFFTGEVLKSFGGMIARLVTGQGLGVELSGPVGIAVITGKVAAMGFVYLLQFAAMLSINLGVINVLPFPALDGGRILFLIIEKLRGRAVNERLELVAHNLGFVLLMVLVVLVTYRDFVNYGGEIIGAFRALI